VQTLARQLAATPRVGRGALSAPLFDHWVAWKTPPVLVVRGTKKLRDRLKAPPAAADDATTTVLGDWFANVLFWRPHTVLLVNSRTLLPVFMPLAPGVTLLDRIPAAIATHLHAHGASEDFLAAELAAMNEIRIAPTNDRSVLGVMNEFAYQGEMMVKIDRITDLDQISLRLSRLLVGPLMAGNGSPDKELASVLGADRSNVIPFPKQPVAPTLATTAATAYQLKITLRGIKPTIWRRVLVDGSATLDEVHEVIQAAFGWWNYHLYEFEFGRTRYGIPDPDWDFGPPTRDSRTTSLAKVAKAGTPFTYTYDFGDHWVHKVLVEKVVPAAADIALPACIDGRRAAPPEDCGGTWGYAELIEILADPTHPDHAERAAWAGQWSGRNDLEAFDPAEFADNLQVVRDGLLDD
jgi:hypothetical protein